jgi:hypothetical protein
MKYSRKTQRKVASNPMAKHDVMHLSRLVQASKAIAALEESLNDVQTVNELGMNEVGHHQASTLRMLNDKVERVRLEMAEVKQWWMNQSEEMGVDME